MLRPCHLSAHLMDHDRVPMWRVYYRRHDRQAEAVSVLATSIVYHHGKFEFLGADKVPVFVVSEDRLDDVSLLTERPRRKPRIVRVP